MFGIERFRYIIILSRRIFVFFVILKKRVFFYYGFIFLIINRIFRRGSDYKF